MGCTVGVLAGAPVVEPEDAAAQQLSLLGDRVISLADALMAKATPGRLQDKYEVYNASLGKLIVFFSNITAVSRVVPTFEKPPVLSALGPRLHGNACEHYSNAASLS